jgi:hypothetical protein
MNKKILLVFPLFLLLTSWVFAQDTYSYGFNLDVKGYDVIPISKVCSSCNPLDEQCVAVGTVYNSLGAGDPDNGLHFIRFDKNGSLLASKYINNPNADERAIKILSIDSNCNFMIISLFREYSNGATDVIKLTSIDSNGLVFKESYVKSTNTSFSHLYPMDAAIKDGYIYIVGSAVKNPTNTSLNIGFGLNFYNHNKSFVYKAKLSNLTSNQLFLFGEIPITPNSTVYNSCYNVARTIKFTPDGRIFVLGMANNVVSYQYPIVNDYVLPGAMIAELSNTTPQISIVNYKVYKDLFSTFVGNIAVDLYYDNHSDSMNILVNDLKVEHNLTASLYGNQTLLPWDAYRVYKVAKSNFAHLGTNEFQPFDNLYATNFVEQSNGNLKVVGWQYTSDASNTSPTTIFRDCPFIQNVKIDNNVSNFMLPISLNTLVDGTLNLTNPYQSVGGNNLSSIWELPRIGSLSGVYDNVVLTGTHLLSSAFGLKCIFTDNLGNSCSDQEMTYNYHFSITQPPTVLNYTDSFFVNNYSDTVLSLKFDWPLTMNFSCNKDFLFKKSNTNSKACSYKILPNQIHHGDGFRFVSDATINSIKKIYINIFSSLGSLVYSDLFDFYGDVFVNPKIETSGIFYIDVNVDGKIFREKLVVF